MSEMVVARHRPLIETERGIVAGVSQSHLI